MKERKREAEGGFAVLMVVLVLAGLAIIAAPFAVSMIFQQRHSVHFSASVKARASARAVASHAIAQLLRTHETYEFEMPFMTPYVDTSAESRITLDELVVDGEEVIPTRDPRGTMLAVSVTDEQSKVNIDTAPLLLLENIFAEIMPSLPGEDYDQKKQRLSPIAQQIVFYRSNVGEFGSIEELTSLSNLPQMFPLSKFGASALSDVAHLSYEDIAFLRRYLTVYSERGININTAPREVVVAVITGLSHKKPGVSSSQLQELGTCTDPQTGQSANCGDGTISQICFPAGYTGETWTVQCYLVDWTGPDYTNRERRYWFSVKGSRSGNMRSYVITESSQPMYISDNGEISFVIQPGSTEFQKDDGWQIQALQPGQGGDIVEHQEAQFVADYLLQTVTLSAEISPGDASLTVNEDISKFPDYGWLSISGDAIYYTSRDDTNRTFTCSQDPEDGISYPHSAGDRVRLIYTSPADLYAVLEKALEDASADDTVDPITGQITDLGTLSFSADDLESIYLNAVNPDDELLISSTVPFVFRSSGVFTITATGIVNDPSGNEVAKETVREVVQATPPELLKWQLTSQSDFLQEVRLNSVQGINTFPVPVTVRDLPEDKHYAFARPVSGSISSGDTSVSVADTTQFKIGRRVRISGVDSNGFLHEEYRTVTSVGSSSISLDAPLSYDYSTATVSDAGDVRLYPYRPLLDPTTRSFWCFDDKTTEDVLDADWTSGTKTKQSGVITWQDVTPEGVRIAQIDSSGAMTFRADDGSFQTQLDQYGNRLTGGWIEFWFKPQWYDRYSHSGQVKYYYLLDLAQGYFRNRITIFYYHHQSMGDIGVLVFCIADSTIENNFSMLVVPVEEDPSEVDQGEIAIVDDTWYHLQAVWKGSGYGQMALFIDGNSVGEFWPSAVLQSDMSATGSGTYAISGASVSGTYGFPAEFTVPSGVIRIEDELINYDSITASTLRVPSAGPDSPFGRGRRITRATEHKTGTVIIPFGYVRSIDKRLYQWTYSGRDSAEYPNDKLFNGSDACALSEALPSSNPQTTIDLEVTIMVDDDNDPATPDVQVTTEIKSEAQDDGTPITDNIDNSQVTPTAEYIPIEDSTNFQTSGYVYIRDPSTGAEERVYYNDIEEDKELTVLVEDDRAEGQVFKVKKTCLIIPTDPTGRGVLDTEAQSFDHDSTVRLISARVSNNLAYARGFYSPAEQQPPPPPPPGGWGAPPPWWDPDGDGDPPWPPDWDSRQKPEEARYAYIEIDDEWIGYTWPSKGSDGQAGSADDITASRDGYYYFVGAKGLIRAAAGTAAQEHSSGAVVYPVFFSGDIRLGPGDRVTVRDDYGTEEEKTIKWANANGYLFSLGQLPDSSQSAFLVGNYYYSRNPRILKFPTGDLPALTPGDVAPDELLWVGSCAKVPEDPTSPHSPAQAVIDDLRISASMHTTMRLYAVSPRSTYSDYDGDGNPDPPVNKRLSGSEVVNVAVWDAGSGEYVERQLHPTDAHRIATDIEPSDPVPFTIKVGNLYSFVRESDYYPSDYWDSSRRNFPLPPFRWQGISWWWPKQGYIKIDSECFYYQTLYWMGDRTDYVDENLAWDDSSITLRSDANMQNYPEQGYLYISARQPNSGYLGHEYLDKYVRDPFGHPIPMSVNVNSTKAVPCPMDSTCSCGLWHYSGYIGDYWAQRLGITSYDPYYPEYNHTWGYHTEVVFYASKDDSQRTFLNVQRAVLDSTPTSYSLSDPFLSQTPLTFIYGVNSDPQNPNVWIKVHDLNGVELEILARACLGTTPAKHTIGSVVMPLENISATHAVSAYNSALATESDTRPGTNTALNDRFPESAILRLEDHEGNFEVVAYSARSGCTFTGVDNLRQRFGTSALSILDDPNFGLKANRADPTTDPTPWYGTSTSMSSFHPIIATLIPWRYWDGTPAVNDGVRDYDAPGVIYFKAYRRVKDAIWRGITWEDTLPPASHGSFNIRVVVRLGGSQAPSWDTDPDADPNDGLFEFSTTDPEPSKRPPVRRVNYPSRSAYESALSAMNNLNDFPADEMEIRVFLEYPQSAYNFNDWGANEWKKSPFLDTMIITYKAPSRTIERMTLSF